MCGIAGELLRDTQTESPMMLDRANYRQRLRGPDGGGIYNLGRLTLGHRRLKIFDLSDRAAQPMVDHVLGLALVFNGAIYNFPELRKELEAKGYQFISDSDTEVLMKAYHAWGDGCVSRFRGMFAFAIWERDTGRLVLARDRLGIKPLYYADSPSGFRFASTLQALLEFADVDKSLDAEALHYYLMFHAVPEPCTMLAGVRKLAPGSILTLHPDGRKEERVYWKFQLGQQNDGLSEEQWLEEMEKAMQSAINRQVLADVPLGVLLSGGLDSSLIVALAAEKGEKQLETFSIGFESASGESGDEFYYSDMVAQHFNTRHHRHFISNKELADALGDCVAAMSEPMVSHDNIGFYLLSHEVSKQVKVVLSGQGADEVFAGYHWFQQTGYLKTAPEQAAQILAEIITDRGYDEYSDTVTGAYRTGFLASRFLQKMCKESGSPYLLEHLLTYETTFALANGPLGRVDNMTMASSLEARVPFLDEDVVELAMRMPLNMKLPEGGKYILKKLGRKWLPKEVVDRPKGYFPVPALKYMQGPTLALMQDVLTPERVKARGIFNPQMVEKLLAEPELHLTPSGGSKLWQIGLLEFWLQQQGL